jgi:radical SAM superfamily enzyme YgiQ (UPF0313 family)
MRYQGRLWRPPSEAKSYILQATIGCSHNLCTYCDMYRGIEFRVRDLPDVLEDIALASEAYPTARKVFVADGDSLVMDTDHWLHILGSLAQKFSDLHRVSCYATAQNVLEKKGDELRQLREAGLSLLYIGPESGDAVTLKRIVKGNTFEDHAEAARKAHEAGMKISVIMLLGIGGVERTVEHAQETARLVTEMDPEYLSALTLTVIPGTPLERMMSRGRFEVPSVPDLLRELQTIVRECRPTRALFRTNHASNYLPIQGRLPRDRDRIVGAIEEAIQGKVPLRPEYWRGL